MAVKRVRSRVASNHRVRDFILDDPALDQLATALASGTIPMTFNHDPDRPLEVWNVTAGVEDLDDGHRAVWAEFDVDEDDWAAVQEEIEKAGAPGGFSITFFEPLEGMPIDGEFQIAADAYYYSDDEILSAASHLTDAQSVGIARIHQLSAVPDAAVALAYGANVLLSIPGNLLASMLYDAARSFLPSRSSRNVFKFERREADGAITKAHIVTSDPEELRRTIEAFVNGNGP
ncbi:HK97 family phage prohead protease [Rhodococcus qingshengii]|uniref:HK97 family phage prohead protease n=1 Tax=Rhodococcus qingshengii TaxID=334542 RepID=UPI001A53F985|nr:HK97 family phage prohead protease [Rhodococcus qingshengii]ULD38987.1 HK97 family phage prohead protease [Rhodococcus qingshengii]